MDSTTEFITGNSLSATVGVPNQVSGESMAEAHPLCQNGLYMDDLVLIMKLGKS
jgi:hypothetical protein